jgi:hypothetical protein
MYSGTNLRRGGFPWTFDQYQRYAVLREFLKELKVSLQAIPRSIDLERNGRTSERGYKEELKRNENRENAEGSGQIGQQSLNHLEDLKIEGHNLRVLDVGGASPLKDGSGYWLPLEAIWEGTGFSLDLIYFPFKDKRFIQADGLHLPLPDRSVDVVAALDVLEHIADRDRKIFIDELCRVSSNLVIVSCPVDSSEIIRADRFLFESIKKIYGLEHCQLKEHLVRGLPKREEVTAWLKQKMPAGVEFFYGSVSRWLVFQTFRLLFHEDYRRQEIFDLLDRLALNLDPGADFVPPFSRHFWVYSRCFKAEELEKMARRVEERLRHECLPFSFDDALKLSKLLSESRSSSNVSALVISEGQEDILGECLRHLLSQKIETTLEISVWVIKGKLEPGFKKNFPGVRFYENQGPEIRMNQLRERIIALRGDWVLLLSENILLPGDAVFSLYREALKLEPGYQEEKRPASFEAEGDIINRGDLWTFNGRRERLKPGEIWESVKLGLQGRLIPVLCPRIVRGEKKYGVWCGRIFSPLRLLAGRMNNPFWKFSARDSSWLFSECLFFPKPALFARSGKEGKIKKREIFFWCREVADLKFFYHPEIVVYYK